VPRQNLTQAVVAVVIVRLRRASVLEVLLRRQQQQSFNVLLDEEFPILLDCLDDS